MGGQTTVRSGTRARIIGFQLVCSVDLQLATSLASMGLVFTGAIVLPVYLVPDLTMIRNCVGSATDPQVRSGARPRSAPAARRRPAG
jgi:hypothetical protein